MDDYPGVEHCRVDGKQDSWSLEGDRELLEDDADDSNSVNHHVELVPNTADIVSTFSKNQPND